MLIRPLLAASIALLIALPARAAQKHSAVTLTYLPSRSVVAVCPEADHLAIEVHVRLGYEFFQPSAPNHLTVKLDRIKGRFRAVAEMVDDDGNLVFAQSYTEIECAMAVYDIAVGLSIQFMQMPEPPPLPPSPPEPAPTSAAETPPPSRRDPAPPPPVAPLPLPERHPFQAGVATVFSLGTAPTVMGGVAAFLGMRWPSTTLALEGRALFVPSATLDHVPVRDGYRFTYTALSGTACYQPGWFFACARVEIGNLSFGNSTVRLSPTSMTILGLGARFGGDVQVTSSLALRAYFELLGQPLSGTLNVDPGYQPIWSQTGFSASIGLGPVIKFSGI